MKSMLPCTLKLRHTGSSNHGRGGEGAMITENLSCTLSTLQDQTLITAGGGALCYDGYNQRGYEEVSMTLRSAMTGNDGNDADPKIAYGINPVASGVMLDAQPIKETSMTLRKSAGGENGVISVGFKAGQSANGGLGDEHEVSPTLSHQPSALEPTVAQSQCDLSQMRYIVRRFTPKEAERLMGLPDGYTIPVGLRRFFRPCPDGQAVPDQSLVSEFQRIFDTFGAIMHDYALASYKRSHREGEPPPKPPKPKSAAQVAAWLAKISDPATCPDSPRYRGCGNGWATNQPRWILLRLLQKDGIDPFTGDDINEKKD